MLAACLYGLAGLLGAALFARGVHRAWRQGHVVAQERYQEWLDAQHRRRTAAARARAACSERPYLVIRISPTPSAVERN